MLAKGNSYNEIWHNCLLLLKEQVSSEEFVRWFKPIVPLEYNGEMLRLRVPDEDYVAHIERNYRSYMKSVISSEFGSQTRWKYAVPQLARKEATSNEGDTSVINSYIKNTDSRNIQNPAVIPGIRKIIVDPQLNFDYTFANFVEGDCNRFARSTGMAAAIDPGNTAFNPIFIYGESGLGKTHLAQAIGIEVKKRFPDKNVLYVSAHKFQVQFQNAALRGEINDFIHFYQMIDVLIIDDIQEIAGRPKTQNTFFNIFCHLQLARKQLVLTCDRPPVELNDIEQRLITRFKWGVSAEITVPDYETKIKIIKSKCQRLNVVLEDDVIDFLATHINANVREIEGAISSLMAHVTLLKTPASISLAREILKAYVKYTKKSITPELICKEVCDFYNISNDDFISARRTRDIAQARQVVMYLCKSFTKMSLKGIGAIVGGKNHSTVVHSCKTIANLAETDKQFKNQLDEIIKRLNV